MGFHGGAPSEEIKVNGTSKKMGKIDVRQLTNDAILQVVTDDGSLFFLMKKSDSEQAEEQKDIVSIYSAGVISKVKHGTTYHTTVFSPKKLLNPVIREQQVVIGFDFSGFMSVFYTEGTLQEKEEKLHGSIFYLGPIKEMYLWD